MVYVLHNTMKDFQPEPFHPSRRLKNEHVQSILGSRLRPTRDLQFRRERLTTPDDDFVDIDIPYVPGVQFTASAPVVLVLHGLEGNARRGYMCETYRQLAYRGIRAVGLNFRTCSGEMNRQPHMYHGGKTDDVILVLKWLDTHFPTAAQGIVGFSLGANITLKYLGETAVLPPRLIAAVAISPPFDMAVSGRTLDTTARFYGRLLLSSIKRKAKARAAVLQHKIDLTAVRAAKSFYQLDTVCTAPLYGFKNANDYYTQVSSQQFLPTIHKPTLILRALDDPFFIDETIPYNLLSQNPNLHSCFTAHGGHLGFIEGKLPGTLTWWAERQAARFLAAKLLS